MNAPQYGVIDSGTEHAVDRGPRADLSAWDLHKGPDSPGARRHESAARNRLLGEYYESALEIHAQIEKRAPRYKAHAHVRSEIADYLDQVTAALHCQEYSELAMRLRTARTSFTWGADFSLSWLGPEHVKPVMQWDEKAGVAKLCPDDARDDAKKIWKTYGPRIEAELAKGRELHYAVAAPPNVDRGELEQGIAAGFKHLHDGVMYGRRDGKIARSIDDKVRRLPFVHGMLVILEDPLAARGDWNAHFNCFLITDPRPDYGEIRAALGWHLHIEPVGGTGRPTEAEIISAAKEAIKYPLQGIPAKSIDKAAEGETIAPPVVQWPFDAFDEWWKAHKGLRRVRSWGSLYRDPNGLERIEDPAGGSWLGRGRCSSADFSLELPLPHIRDLSSAIAKIENLGPCIKITGAAGAQGPPGATERPFRPTYPRGPAGGTSRRSSSGRSSGAPHGRPMVDGLGAGANDFSVGAGTWKDAIKW